MPRFVSRYPAALVALLSVYSLSAQEQLGMRLERYSGIYAATINPAAMSFNPSSWEVSLFSADAFINNSYAFLRETSIPNALKNSNKIVSAVDGPRESHITDPIYLDYSDDNRKMFAVVQTRITGPSFSFRFGDNWTIGLVTAFRANVSAYRLPELLRYRTIRNLPRNQIIQFPPAGLAGMAWTEIGIPISKLNSDGGRVIAYAVTPKLLLGMEGFYSKAQSKFDYTQRQGDTTAFGNAKWDYGLTTDNLNASGNGFHPRINGAGFAVDLGFSWAEAVNATAPEEGYNWRVGVSLIDLGFVRFSHEAEKHHIAFDTTITVSKSQFPPSSDPHALITQVSQAFLGNSAASLQANAFSIGMPTSLSIQGDYRFSKQIYVAGVWVQRLAFLPNSIKQPSTVAIVPRFEHRWFSLSVPLVWSDYQFARIGLAARLGVLYLGTDNLGSFMKSARQTGTDFYVGLKINAFSLHFGEKKTRSASPSTHNSRDVSRVKCFQF
jgi:hypothetical protein